MQEFPAMIVFNLAFKPKARYVARHFLTIIHLDNVKLTSLTAKAAKLTLRAQSA